MFNLARLWSVIRLVWFGETSWLEVSSSMLSENEKYFQSEQVFRVFHYAIQHCPCTAAENGGGEVGVLSSQWCSLTFFLFFFEQKKNKIKRREKTCSYSYAAALELLEKSLGCMNIYLSP